MHALFNKKSPSLLVTALSSIGLALLPNIASASNFQDFSGINYSNPADLVYLVKDMQFILGGSLASPIITFNGTVTVPNPVPILGPGITTTGSSSNEGNFYVPYGRFAKRLNDQWVFGVDVTEPFREDIEYSATSNERYSGTVTEITSLDVAPSVAYQFGGALSKLSIGFGVDALYTSANINGVYPSLPAITTGGLVPFGAGPDVNATNYATDWAYGWHAGLNYHLFRGTFIGLSYFSTVTPKLTGTSTFSGYPANLNLSSTSTLPATSNFTLTQFLNERLLVQARVFYTQWDSIQQIVLLNTAGPAPNTAILPTGYHNTWRFELRSHYDMTPKIAIQGLLGYDQTPTVNAYRSTRLPDADRYLVAIGGEYKITKAVGLMFNYAHAFAVGTPTINNVDPITGITTSGTTEISDGNLYELRLTVNT